MTVSDRFAGKVRKEIANFYFAGRAISPHPVLNALKIGMNNEMHMEAPAKMEGELEALIKGGRRPEPGGKIQVKFLQLNGKDGDFCFPVYTDDEEAKKGPEAVNLKHPFSQILKRVSEFPKCSGLMINPMGEKYLLTRPMAESLPDYRPRPVLAVVRGDIVKMHVDAVVNAANNSLLGGGGVDGAIHRAAGKNLVEECRLLGGCRSGDVKMTGAWDLPDTECILHAVGPIYTGYDADRAMLASCYRKSLELAYQRGCLSIAFPCISTGAYGYPKEEAARISLIAVNEWIRSHPGAVMNIYFCCYEEESAEIYRKLLKAPQKS